MRLRETTNNAHPVQNPAASDKHTQRTGQGNGVLGQREGKVGNRAQKNPDVGRHNNQSHKKST